MCQKMPQRNFNALQSQQQASSKHIYQKGLKEQHQGFQRGPPPQYQPGQIMLNFAEQTGSGAVMIVWSFLPSHHASQYMTALLSNFPIPQPHHTAQDDTPISYSSLTHITCIIYHYPPDQVIYKSYPKKWHDLVLLYGSLQCILSYRYSTSSTNASCGASRGVERQLVLKVKTTKSTYYQCSYSYYYQYVLLPAGYHQQ